MENIKQSIDQLNTLLAHVKNEQSSLMSKLTPDQLAIIAPMQMDITNALDALKKGDANLINDLQKKYADISN